jgi:hypothetical protein
MKKKKCCEYDYCGPYYKNITIVNDINESSWVMSQFGASIMAMNYAPRVVNYAPKEHS